jgi:hypothetical protein
METRGTYTRLCRIVAVIEEVHRFATGTALSEETASNTVVIRSRGQR